jgi:outer membrane protein assembly factor BamB
MKYQSLLLVLVLSFGSFARAEENWPQFRGPRGDGISDGKGAPGEWGVDKNVKWRTAIHGKAWSSPVVWGKQVWMSSATADGHELYAVCVDADSGKIVYDIKLFDVPNPQYCIPFNSYGSPSPCIEEGRVYVTFGAPGTACLDTATGKVLWARTDFVCNHYRSAGSSPTLWHDALFMNFDGSDHQFVVALDKKTGQTVWRTERSTDYADLDPSGKPRAEGDFRKAFSSPRIASVDGKDQLISLGSKAIYGYDPVNGNELWRLEIKTSFSGSDTPVIADGVIYYGTGHGSTDLVAFRPGSGVLGEKDIVWRTHKSVPTRSSVLVVDGLVYMTTDAGIVNCLDAKTGKVIWHDRIDGQYSASPIYAGGNIYFFSEEGVTTVLAGAKEFKVLARNQLPEGFMATPAVAGNALFLRTRTALYRVEK